MGWCRRFCFFCYEVRVVGPLCGSDPAVEVKADVGVSVALTWGQGGKEPGSLRGSLAWQQVGLGPGLGQEAFSSSFSLHFRSPMSLPSTLTPPTPSAQVSVKPTCICPGFTPGLAISLGRRGGGVRVSVLFSPLPSPRTCSGWQMGRSWNLESGGPGFKASCCPFLAV